MPHDILLNCERRCAPFVWMQAVSPVLTRSFALPPARANLCPPIQMQTLPPQQAGKQQVHTYPLHCSTEGLQVRPQKQLRKYGWLAVPKAVHPLRTETLIISKTHHHLSLSVLFSHITIRGHSLSFFFFPNPAALSDALLPAPSTRFHVLVEAFYALTADEVLQMKPYTCTPNHSL